MNIKINNTYTITKDNYNIIVVETIQGTNPKTQEPTTNEKKTYHPNLEQACIFIMKRIDNKAEINSINDLINVLNCNTEQIIEALKGK